MTDDRDLTFDAAQRADRITAVCSGVDGTGTPVRWELDPATLGANLSRQAIWAFQVAACDRLYRGLVGQGMDPDVAYAFVSATLPAAIKVSIADLAQRDLVGPGGDSQDGDEALESLDDGDR